LSRLGWWALRLILRQRRLARLLNTGLVGLWLLPLQDRGLLRSLGSLRALRVNRLRGKLSADRLLLLLLSLRGLLVVLLLLMGPLQDLGSIMGGRSTMHAWERWLPVRKVLRWVARG
jgi:hypothetical protein